MSVWRHLAAGGLSRRKARLTEGMKILKTRRDGKGRWKQFPFYYTVLALTEIGGAIAKSEMSYAAEALQRTRRSVRDKYALRRRALAERIEKAV